MYSQPPSEPTSTIEAVRRSNFNGRFARDILMNSTQLSASSVIEMVANTYNNAN